MPVASGLVSSGAEAKAVAQRPLVSEQSLAALDKRCEAILLCGWTQAGLLRFDTDRLIERSVFLDALGCALFPVRPRMCSCQQDVAGHP